MKVLFEKPMIMKERDGNATTYHFRKRVTLKDDFATTPLGEKLKKEIEIIEGVTRVFTHLNSYSINIYKGEAFTWEEIEPAILSVLKWALK